MKLLFLYVSELHINIYGNMRAATILATCSLMIKYNVVKQVPYVSAASTLPLFCIKFMLYQIKVFKKIHFVLLEKANKANKIIKNNNFPFIACQPSSEKKNSDVQGVLKSS